MNIKQTNTNSTVSERSMMLYEIVSILYHVTHHWSVLFSIPLGRHHYNEEDIQLETN